MAITDQEQKSLVRDAYPGAILEKCQQCDYFIKYLPGARARENGKYCGACVCDKKGNGTGPLC